MKRIVFATCATMLSLFATAQTGRKDSGLKPPPPPPPVVTMKKFAPPRIVKDTAIVKGKKVGKEPKGTPPPPPPPPVVVKDTVEN